MVDRALERRAVELKLYDEEDQLVKYRFPDIEQEVEMDAVYDFAKVIAILSGCSIGTVTVVDYALIREGVRR